MELFEIADPQRMRIPVAGNDNLRRPCDRLPGETSIAWDHRVARLKAGIGLPPDTGTRLPRRGGVRLPIEDEFAAGRIPEALMFVADDIATLFENSGPTTGVERPRDVDPGRAIGQEVTVDIRRDLRTVIAACGHLWKAVEMGVMRRATMRAIGEAFGAASDAAATIGREKLKDGLTFAARTLAMQAEVGKKAAA